MSPQQTEEPGEIRIVPANQAGWDDLQSILTGSAARCQCERQRLGDGDWWNMPVEERRDLLRGESHCGDPRAAETIGLVAYLGDDAVGWCAVDRRSVYGRLRGSSVPWKGRDEDKNDDGVWAIACLIVRPGFRRRGLTYPMVVAAVDHARAQGATAIEGYPLLTGGSTVSWGEMNVGAVGPFAAAGFTEVSHPTTRRVVMRLDL
ncbi:GNAT family N-acetyltransferase [Microbacterium sp. NPDC057944]|uniref:GNAT family N-acetyltransferase n=1 Tax=Microbacterium sp. NPDC057944 TaxID=3346286 RepID=UPI0036D8C4F3